MISGASPRMVKLVTLIALGGVVGAVTLGGSSAPAQTGFLVCVKSKKPGKGALRLPSGGSCRGNERGIFLNQTGPRGPQGVQGPIGPQGIPGTNGSPGVSGYTTASATSVPQSDGTETQNVSCGTKTVLGGGYVIATSAPTDSNKVFATSSFPVNASTWQVKAEVVDGSTLTPLETWTVTAWATCATVAP